MCPFVKAIMESRQLRELKIQEFMNKVILDLWEEQKHLLGF